MLGNGVRKSSEGKSESTGKSVAVREDAGSGTISTESLVRASVVSKGASSRGGGAYSRGVRGKAQGKNKLFI